MPSRLASFLLILSILTICIAQDHAESQLGSALEEKSSSSTGKRFVDGEEPTLNARGEPVCGSTRCKEGTKSCCSGNADFACCPLRNASCCGSYCCDHEHPVCCGGGYCCGREFSMCCGGASNSTRWCCAGNMVCGDRPNSCERPETAFPKIGLGILGVLIGLTVVFQLFNLARRLFAPPRQVQAHELATRPRRMGDNSVVDLELSDEEEETNLTLRQRRATDNNDDTN